MMDMNKIEESIFDKMNKIDDEADAEVIPTLHCETCGAELDPFGNCEKCGPESRPFGEYQITVGEPDGSTFTYDFDNFDDAHKFACDLEPDEEITETNQAYKDAYNEWSSFLSEGSIGSAFANNIDADILAELDGSYDAPVTDNFVKCGKSVVSNALYYVSQGEEVEFCLGNIELPCKQITHCWVVHNGEVAQTRVPKPDVKLIKKFTIELAPHDVEGAKQKIQELINSI